MYYAKKLWAAGGGVVYNFVPFVAPESFNDPRKYADFGLTVNLYEKFKIYKMTWAGADIAVEFSDAIASVAFTSFQIGQGMIEIFETVAGVETSVLRTTAGTHTFTNGSTKRYMIRRTTSATAFTLPIGSVWAYCCCIVMLSGYNVAGYNAYLKYIFFYEHTLTSMGYFRGPGLQGTLTIPSGITLIYPLSFLATQITKVVTSNNLTTINGGNFSGAFMGCTSLQVADLGEGITSIGTDTFRDCTSLASIICRAYNPPTLEANAFRGIPSASPLITKFYVPNNRVAAYKAATGWINFASRIFSINDL